MVRYYMSSGLLYVSAFWIRVCLINPTKFSRDPEQIAMNKLVELAYKKLLVRVAFFHLYVHHGFLYCA